MSSTNRSSSANTIKVRNRAIAMYHKSNPNRNGGSLSANLDSSMYTNLFAGDNIGPCCNKTPAPVIVCPGEIIITYYEGTIPDSPDPAYPYGLGYTYNVESGVSYSFSTDITTVIVSSTPGIVYIYTDISNWNTFTITGTKTSCNPVVSTITYPCFLAGSLVTLADGSTLPIEDIEVGMELLGAFGEINTVLALHRPLLGSGKMANINGEHSTSSHHPHISVDKGFYAVHPAVVDKFTYGREHEVLNADGNKELRFLHGLKPGRTQTLELGIVLKTVEGGRVVKTFEITDMSPETQLYNLVMGGSHTYHVDGYAVTGWPREDDFDYEAWIPKY